MRTLGEVIMIVALLALLALAVWVRYLNFRPFRELLNPAESPARRSPHLRFFADHSARFLLPLFLLLGVGWLLRHYG